MSIRTEPKEMSPGMAQALTLPQHVMTAAQAEGPLMAPAGAETAMVSAPVNDQHLAGANDFNTSNPHHPLKRTVVINIRSSLADLCLKKSRATWSPPSSEATKAIFQKKKFTDLQGNSEAQVTCNVVVEYDCALLTPVLLPTGRPQERGPAQDGHALDAEHLPHRYDSA